MAWENVSRYSQSEEGREVRTVQVQAGGSRVVVTRMHGNEGWWLHVYGLDMREMELQGKDLETAKAEAVERVRHKLIRVLEELPGGKT